MRKSCFTLGLLMVAMAVVNTGAADTASLPTNVDLRPSFEKLNISPRRQFARPTCSVFTVAGGLEFAIAKKQGHSTRLSVEYLNWAGNKVCNEMDDGGFFSDLWKGFAQYGICTEENLPYASKFDTNLVPNAESMADAKTRLGHNLRIHWIKEWNVHTGLKDEEFNDVKRTLSQGWPVCGGFRWPKKESWKDDVLQMCPSNSVRDGHSILMIGYRDDTAQPGGGVFIFRNSAGGGKDGLMPYEYAKAYMNDAVWFDFEARVKTSVSSTSPRVYACRMDYDQVPDSFERLVKTDVKSKRYLLEARQ